MRLAASTKLWSALKTWTLLYASSLMGKVAGSDMAPSGATASRRRAENAISLETGIFFSILVLLRHSSPAETDAPRIVSGTMQTDDAQHFFKRTCLRQAKFMYLMLGSSSVPTPVQHVDLERPSRASTREGSMK